jgi:hypothetical protein
VLSGEIMMKSVLEIVAATVSVFVLSVLTFIFISVNSFIGVPFGLFLIGCWAVARRSKPVHLPLSSPGFLAVFAITVTIFSPYYQDLAIFILGGCLIMLGLSLPILLMTMTTKKRDQRQGHQQTTASYSSPAVDTHR